LTLGKPALQVGDRVRMPVEQRLIFRAQLATQTGQVPLDAVEDALPLGGESQGGAVVLHGENPLERGVGAGLPGHRIIRAPEQDLARVKVVPTVRHDAQLERAEARRVHALLSQKLIERDARTEPKAIQIRRHVGEQLRVPRMRRRRLRLEIDTREHQQVLLVLLERREDALELKVGAAAARLPLAGNRAVVLVAKQDALGRTVGLRPAVQDRQERRERRRRPRAEQLTPADARRADVTRVANWPGAAHGVPFVLL
jgi:hypothetical protein